jgi:hypothetical protein
MGLLSAAARTSRSRVKETAPPSPVGVGQLPRDLVIEWRSVAKVIRYPNNPRENEHAVADVAASLVEFGWEQPIVVDKKGVIIVGDTRYLAALLLQQKSVPVYVAKHLSEAQTAAYRLADNKYGERAEWHFGKLAIEFKGLEAMGADLKMTGFRDFEIAPIVAADWSPPAPAGELEDHQRTDGGSNNGVFKFMPDQVVVLLRATEKYRRDTRNPHVETQEAITRICSRYAPSDE